jgi:hypothetical protein
MRLNEDIVKALRPAIDSEFFPHARHSRFEDASGLRSQPQALGASSFAIGQTVGNASSLLADVVMGPFSKLSRGGPGPAPAC